MGFHAMLRYGAFCQFSPNALTLVSVTGRELAFSVLYPTVQCLGPEKLLGVLFSFVSKFTLAYGLDIAYFCDICDVARWLAAHCPICLVSRLLAKGLLRSSSSRLLLDPTNLSPSALTSNLDHLAH